jgi:hypothetical protein
VSDSRVYRQITGYEWRPPLSRGILVLVMLVLAAGLSLVITGRAWSWRDVVISTKVTPPALAWLPTRYQTPEQEVKAAVLSAYSQSFRILNVAAALGNPNLLSDAFVGQAAEEPGQKIAQARAKNEFVSWDASWDGKGNRPQVTILGSTHALVRDVFTQTVTQRSKTGDIVQQDGPRQVRYTFVLVRFDEQWKVAGRTPEP